MYRKILVPLDGSQLAEQVLPYVRLLGKGLNSHVQLLHVIKDMSPSLTGEAQKYLKRTAESLRDGGFSISSLVHHGDPASDIVAEAELEPGTLIAMATHGRSGLSRWMLGSVTDKVLHATTNPLLVVRAREGEAATTEAKLENVIVPLDESSMAERILPHVVDIAKALGLRVILLRVTPPAEEHYKFMESPPVNFEDLPQFIDEQAVEYLHREGQKLKDEGLSLVEERLLHGHPAAVIVDLAREIPDSLVAMTTHGRSGVDRWLLGSVADRVVRYSDAPVVLIRMSKEMGKDFPRA
jgi:nucleotide-binding universal stress UspA family protein